MYKIYTIYKSTIVNVKYYKTNDIEIRKHYIQSLRMLYLKNHIFLSKLNQYHVNFIYNAIIPYDDNFYFVIEHIDIYDSMFINDKFYEYNFYFNDNINLTLYYGKDDYSIRKSFVEEIKYYLEFIGEYDIRNRLITTFNLFINNDSDSIWVKTCKFSKRDS